MDASIVCSCSRSRRLPREARTRWGNAAPARRPAGHAATGQGVWPLFEAQASLGLLVHPRLPAFDEVVLAHCHERAEQGRACRDLPIGLALSV